MQKTGANHPQELTSKHALVMVDLYAGDEPVLLVEDDQNDVFLVSRALKQAGVKRHIQTVYSGLEAVAYLGGDPPYVDRFKYPLPVLVLLDIKLPLMDGYQVLTWIRRHPQFAKLRVVMLTGSHEVRTSQQAYTLGADSFLVKPLDFGNAAELSRWIDEFARRKLNP